MNRIHIIRLGEWLIILFMASLAVSIIAAGTSAATPQSSQGNTSDLFFVGHTENQDDVTAYYKSNGSVKWQNSLSGGGYIGMVTIGPDRDYVYYVYGDSSLTVERAYAINGTVDWTNTLNPDMRAVAVHYSVARDEVYASGGVNVNGGTDEIYEINPSTGSVNRTFSTASGSDVGGRFNSSTDGTALYAATSDGPGYKINLTSGSKAYEININDSVTKFFDDPTDQYAYAHTEDGLAKVYQSNGTLVDFIELGNIGDTIGDDEADSTYTTVDGESKYIVGHDSKLFKIDGSSFTNDSVRASRISDTGVVRATEHRIHVLPTPAPVGSTSDNYTVVDKSDLSFMRDYKVVKGAGLATTDSPPTTRFKIYDKDFSPSVPVANATVEVFEGGSLSGSNQTNGDGVANVTFDGESGDETVVVSVGGEVRVLQTIQLENGETTQIGISMYLPGVDNASANPVGAVKGVQTSANLSINVSDRDMPSENVTVEFFEYNSSAQTFSDHTFVGSDTLLNNGTANATWSGADDAGVTYQWFAVANDSHSGTGNVTSKVFSFAYESQRPEVFQPLPQPGDVEQNRSQQISVQVLDGDLPNDDITVKFYNFSTGDPSKDPLIGTDGTSNGNSRYSVSWQVPTDTSQATWYVRVNDSYGNVQLSSVFSFGVSGFLRINDSADDALIQDRPIEVRFTQPGQQITRETNNGTLRLPALPLANNESIGLRIRAAGYYEAKYDLTGTTGNVTAYLEQCPTYSSPPDNPDQQDDCDPSNFSSRVIVTFKLDDRTGEFDAATTRLEIRGSINTTTDEKVLLSSRFGGSNSVTTSLAKGEEFSLRVENKNGDVRSLGNFLADSNETVTLTVGEIGFDTGDPGDQGYRFDASLLETQSGGETIRVSYNDTQNVTNDARFVISERGNSSNVLKEWQFARVDSFQGTVFVPPSQRNKTWVVSVTADRGGSKLQSSVLVGTGQLEPGITIASRWEQLASVLLILISAAIVGGGTQAELGAIVASLVAGTLYLIGWLDGVTSGGMIVLALFLAVMWRIRGPTQPGVR